MSADESLAAERTSLAWQRTGMTMMATGTAMLRLLPSSPWRIVLSVAMVLTGAVVTLGAQRMHPAVPHRRSVASLAGAVAAFAAIGAALSLL